jgi:hypothetical protein
MQEADNPNCPVHAPGNANAEPTLAHYFDPNDDLFSLKEAVRTLQDLVGLRFIIDAKARTTKSGKTFTLYTWTRDRS